jgi:hypothetical protein
VFFILSLTDKEAVMTEFLQTMLSFPTVIFTFFMCLCLILWLMTIFGLVGFEAGDIDVDVDVEAGISSSVGEAVGILSRFGLGGSQSHWSLVCFLFLVGFFQHYSRCFY